MKIIDKLTDGKVHISLELFPPKQNEYLTKVDELVEVLSKKEPSYISVTYGAGGGTSDKTVQIAKDIQNKYNIPSLAHLTCVSSSKGEVLKRIESLKKENIENILALRGDLPTDSERSKDFKYASELIEEIKKHGDFCIGGACYPEGHPEAKDIWSDIDNLKRKVESGCEFLTTQMFFDNNVFYNFMYKVLKKGINVPVVAGIMPVVNAKQIKRTMSLSGGMLPSRFKAIVERFGDDNESMKQAGITYASEQIIDLIANGVNNIHIYTMNKSDTAGKIMDNLNQIYRK